MTTRQAIVDRVRKHEDDPDVYPITAVLADAGKVFISLYSEVTAETPEELVVSLNPDGTWHAFEM